MPGSVWRTRPAGAKAVMTKRGQMKRVIVIGLLCATWTIVLAGQGKPYTPKNGVLNWKALVLGGSFRVTMAIPLHGDFSRFTRLEIVRTQSLIGSNVPPNVLEELTLGLAAEFHKSGRFSDTAIVDSLSLPAAQPAPPSGALVAQSFRNADPIDAPMRTWDDLVMFDRERQAAAKALEDVSHDTLVVQCQVIDYAKGNKFLQFLFLDFGNAVLTLRFSYFDRGSGEELGRSVISSDNSAAIVPSAFSTRTALTGVIEGLVDQVTRRKLAGER